MVAVNCAGLPETLLESELFGHVKGSFTGAYRDKQGKLEMADGGSIFLDEIGEMTLRMQGLLLRFMETGELQKVGADRAMGRVNVRVIAATNRNLRDMITEGHVPRGPVLSVERHSPDRAAAARAPGRHPVAHRALPGGVHAQQRHARARDFAGSDQAAVRLRLAGQRARARERHRAAGRDRPEQHRRRPTICRWRFGRIRASGCVPKRERRRTVADDLYKKLVEERESFWTAVYPLYMQREITRGNMRDLVRKGLEDARGNYKIVAKLFNMEQRDYKRFLNFLRKHDCQLPFKEYRQ